MDDDDRAGLDDRTPDQPAHGPRRSTITPLLMTVLVLALVIGILVLLTFVANYNATDG